MSSDAHTDDGAQPVAEGGTGEDPLWGIVRDFAYREAGGARLDLDEFCAAYPEDLRPSIRRRCREALEIQRTLRASGRSGLPGAIFRRLCGQGA